MKESGCCFKILDGPAVWSQGGREGPFGSVIGPDRVRYFVARSKTLKCGMARSSAVVGRTRCFCGFYTAVTICMIGGEVGHSL